MSTSPGWYCTSANDRSACAVNANTRAPSSSAHASSSDACTAHAERSFADVHYQPGDVLMFGPEPTGLDEATLADPHITAQVRIPMLAGRRSLNLSNAAAIAAYEAWRQHGFDGAAGPATSDTGAV